MARIYYGQRVALDPTTGQLVTSTSGQIYAITDTTFTTPLAVFDTSGTGMPDGQVKVSAQGVTDEFGVDEPVDGDNSRFAVFWKSGPYVIVLESIRGLSKAAQDARTDAQTARTAAQTAADTVANSPAILPAGGSQGNVLYRGATERTGVWGPPSQGGGGGASTWDQISGKPETFPPSAHTHTATQISDSGTVGRAVLTAADAAAARAAIGAGTGNGTSNLALGATGTTAAPGNHVHAASAVTFAPTGGVTATNVQDAIAQAAQTGTGGSSGPSIYPWRYTGGAWPALPATAPAGVVFVDAIGPSQPTTLPGWIGLAANQVPMRYYQANVA